jgi:hypothetical protein
MKLSLISEKRKKKKTPKPEDFDERTACHMTCDLENSQLDEGKDKDFFDYTSVSKDMWSDKISDAKDEFGVSFDTENDDTMDQQREIKIDRGDKDPCKFACEMYSASGDWEFPVRYFRCELKDGYIQGISKYSNPHFVFVPNGDQGNGQLKKSDGGKWVCPDSDFDDEDGLRDEKKCWDSLKDHLEGLTKKEIEESRRILPEATCSRASRGILRRYRQSLVTLGIPSHKQAQKLRHIS